jgi:F-type H+-transporting ATPase subunit b
MAQQTGKTTASTEQVPVGVHEVFPPFDSRTFPSQLFWLTLVFVALYLLMSRIALPRIASIIDERRRHIDGHLAEAQSLKGQSDAAMTANEMALAEARARAQTLASETRQKSAADAEARRKDMDAKLGVHIAEAEKAIAAARSAAMTNVHDIANDAARAIVERLTGTVPADRDVAEAVRDALNTAPRL